MADEYMITTRSEGLLGHIGRWGAALITDEELLEAVAAHAAEKRAEWEAESGETLREIKKFLSDAEEVGRINDPSERFGTPAEKAAGVVDRAWRTGLRRILTPVTNTESEKP